MKKTVLAVSKKPFPKAIKTWEQLFAECKADFQMVEVKDLGAKLREQDVHVILSLLPYTPKSVQELNRAFPKENHKVPLFQAVRSDEAYSKMPSAVPQCISGFVFLPLNQIGTRLLLDQADRAKRKEINSRELIDEVRKYRAQKNKLVRIGTQLSAQHDLDTLLDLILLVTRDLLNADAGSIYIKEVKETGHIYSEKANRIIFKVAQNDSVQMAEKSKEYPISIGPGTIAGYVAFTNEILNIADVYQIPETEPYQFGRGFDEAFNYRTKSILTVPLENRDGDIVGVLQLINKKKRKRDLIHGEKDVDKIVSFGPNDEEIIVSLASQAAVSIEKAQLYHNIEALFKGFVESSVAAIEARDEATSGHSKRVRAYALKMAEVINNRSEGPFADIYFDARAMREFEFAALLHDVGKIGVREAVLIKPTRLSGEAMEAIEYRWRCITMRENERSDNQQGKDARWKAFEDDLDFLKKLNHATFLPLESKERLDQIRQRTYTAQDGCTRHFLTDHEYEHLSIPKGNLTQSEREMINSHTEYTRQILSRMPWTSDLEGVVNIASHHHEKLDGSGYPDHLKEDEIPLQSRILAVIDIFEALVAQDRPYKPPMPVEKALAILKAEVDAKHLDPNIVKLFVDEKAYAICEAS